MPKVIESTDVPKRSGGGRTSRYPIADWFAQAAKLKNGDRLCLSQGEDFDSTLNSFRNYLHLKARQMGVKLSTITSEDAIYIGLRGEKDGDEQPVKAAKSAKATKDAGKGAKKSVAKNKSKGG